jgi:hypothetical protein
MKCRADEKANWKSHFMVQFPQPDQWYLSDHR